MQAVRKITFRISIASVGWVPIMAIILRIASPATSDASYLVLAAFALTGRVQAVQALALSWFFSMFNDGITPAGGFASIGRYAVIAGAALSILIRNRGLSLAKGPDRMTMLTILLGVFIVFHSVFFSRMPDISILKAVSWTIPMATLFAAWSGLSEDEKKALENWLYGGLIFVMIASLPLTILPVGYYRSSTGFQGVLSHPQSFGPAMAFLGALTLGRIFSRNPPEWISIGVITICLMLIVLSEARTAGAALVLGLVLALITMSLILGKSIYKSAPALRSPRFKGLAFLAMFAAIAAWSPLTDIMTNFVSKSGRAQVTGLFEAYDASRGGRIDAMWQNIKENPWLGIGFGLPSDHDDDFHIVRDPVLGLPMSAPIEKGVAPVMVLEEMGFFGAFFVLVWIWSLFRRAAISGIAQLVVFFVVLLLNFGEAGLFSSGGLGLAYLILLSWVATRTAVRNNCAPAEPFACQS